jgi:hypothetical protein
MNSTSIPPRPPAQAHLKGTAAGVSSNGSSAGPIDTQTSKKTDQNSVSAGKQTSTAIKTSGTSKKWLELCIRSSTDVSILAEIDIAGDKTDHDVFDAIRVAYLKNKHSARLFNRFNYRVSTGGGSVMVCFYCEASNLKYPTLPIELCMLTSFLGAVPKRQAGHYWDSTNCQHHATEVYA